MSLYLNGEKIAEKTGMSTDVTDLGKDLKAYLGISFYSVVGYFKGFVVCIVISGLNAHLVGSLFPY